MIRPLGKNVLVKIKPPEKKQLILTVAINDEPFEAIVMDVGSKAELDIQVGDVLLLVPYCGSKISKQDEGYLLITERDILGVVNGQKDQRDSERYEKLGEERVIPIESGSEAG